MPCGAKNRDATNLVDDLVGPTSIASPDRLQSGLDLRPPRL
jgi:hypothetical protein